MPATLEAPGSTGLYERDEVAWYGAMIELIEQGRTEEVDFTNLKELLASMARSERREVESRLAVLFAHFLKWQYQPEKRSNSWRLTMEIQRQYLAYEIESSGTLRNHAVEILEQAYRKGVRQAAIETGLPLETFPATCQVTLDELLAE
jgi:Domain of unknown function DUF29